MTNLSQEEWSGRSGWIGLALAAPLLISVLVLVWRGVDVSKVACVIAAFLAAAIIVYFPSIKSLEFGNLKAELQDRIDQATATIIQLRVVAVYSVQQTLYYSATQLGQPGGRRTAFEMRDRVIQMLKDIGASSGQLSDALSQFNTAVNESFYYDVSTAIWNNLRRDPTKLRDYINEFNQTFPKNNEDIPPAAAWETFAKRYVTWTPDLDETFQDLAFFQDSKALRRPSVFFAGPLSPL